VIQVPFGYSYPYGYPTPISCLPCSL